MADLRKLAEAATPGPWITSPRSETTIVTEKEDEVADCTFPMWTSRRAPTAAYIAAANPQAVIGLLDERDRLHDLVRHQRGPLHDAGLLTDEESAALAADHGAVGRLETIDQLRASLATVTQERDELRAVGRRLLTAYGGGYFVRKPPYPWESPMVRQDHACHECASDAEPGWRCPYHELRALLGDDTALAGAKS